VDFLQKNFTGILLYITTTYSEKPEGRSSREREILQVFKNPVAFKTTDKDSSCDLITTTEDSAMPY
jgi:hypothetical protein